MKKVIFIILILVIIGLLFIWRVRSSSNPAIKVEKAYVGSIIKTISASGEIVSEEEAELKFQASGQLTWVGVKKGDFVQAYQAIAQLDTRELQKNLEKYLRDYSKERNDFDESKQVTYNGIFITNTIRRILEQNQWDLEKAVLDVELKDLALKFATLITPISGIVTQVDVPIAGVNITPASAVFKVANPDKMIFRANIDETDISQVTASLSATILLDAYSDEKFPTQVKTVSFSSVSTSGGGNAYQTDFGLPENKNLQFKIGMNGDVDVILQKKDNVLIVPFDAVFKKTSKDYVWKVKSGKAILQEVTIGIDNDELIEITKGLADGDYIITSPVSKITANQKISSY
ncbi:MAG: efflux RND transporter periplasmic adaptor subunit [Candidatus Gottesmanbacteria bacterium]